MEGMGRYVGPAGCDAHPRQEHAGGKSQPMCFAAGRTGMIAVERNDPLLSSFAGRADGVPLHASSLQCIRHTDIALLAIRSLHAELVLYPKPGLVSPWDNGSHDDMDAALFMRSLF